MKKPANKRLKRVLIAFVIIMIPLSYIIALAYSIDLNDKAVENAIILHPNDKIEINKSIDHINIAIKIYPWNYSFRMNKAQMLMKLNNYRGALNSAKKGTDLNKQYPYGLEYIGMIYEYLDLPDSAKIYYSKAIDRYKQKLEHKNNNIRLTQEIALLYTFLNDSINANKFITHLSKDTDDNTKELLKIFNFYIENYQSGGLKDFYEGETIRMIHNSINNDSIIDNLLLKNRIYPNTANGTIVFENYDNKKVYRFRKIFEDKAKSIGFIEIKE